MLTVHYQYEQFFILTTEICIEIGKLQLLGSIMRSIPILDAQRRSYT